jgi:isochorismate pyruvate lyase
MSGVNVHPCTTMAEVRQHIDALDAQIVALLARRTGYVAQAGRIKQSETQIVDTPRIEFIVQRVRGLMAEHGAAPDVAEATYRALIGASIDFERGEFARKHTYIETGMSHAD